MLHRGSRQCGLQADAADPHVPPREGGGADGQEHHDAQGHPRTPGKQPGSGEIAASHPGECGLCVHIGYPTVASVPHSIINGYKRVLALSVETDYTFPLAEKVKAFLADPSAFVAAAPVAAATTAAPAAAAAPAKVEAKEESEESDEDMGFGLFD
uniref:Large ribosomal subunit protein uL10 n=1 Tax=Myotis myotis TaxID=51298 RepID=A0A7J7S2W8_MYOMY|nr:ribosomal protein lateral stalk subunit P0 [Myotis myotis]